jgi:nucleoside-diphosphate-sugar epimerase
MIITGSSGFIGQYLIAELARRGIPYTSYQRGTEFVGTQTGAVIHLAGRAHVLQDTSAEPLTEFRSANVVFALDVAKRAFTAGVRRFIYVSSIGVSGGESKKQPLTELDTPAPHTPYAQSKYEGELALLAFGKISGMEIVIIRPPLVYGTGAPGNFGLLMSWMAKRVPLPLGAVHNQRSFLYVANAVDFLILCTHHPKAANQTFLLSDGEDVSTTRLLRTLAKAQRAPSRLLPIPASWLNAAMRMMGKGDMAQRLLGNLQVDSSKARDLLGWTPPFTFEQGIQKSVETKS